MTTLQPALERRDPELPAIRAVLAVLGAGRLVVALATGEVLGAEATVAILMLVAAGLGATAPAVRSRSGRRARRRGWEGG